MNDKKRVTLDDVAAKAGVTAATVSFALSGKRTLSPQTKAAIMQAVSDLGYEPNLHAQRLATGRSHNEVALFSLNMDLGVGTRKLQFLQAKLSARGFKAPIHGYGAMVGHEIEVDRQIIEVVRDLRRQKPRAIVCYTSMLGDEALGELERFQEEGGTLVCYDFLIGLPCDTVVFDRDDNTYQAARHLLERGHKHLGFFTLGKVGGPRLDGFERARREFGVTAPPSLLGLGSHLEPEKAGIEMAQQFLALPPSQRPSGVCIVNDAAALSFIGIVQLQGVRVPHDLSVVGHDNAPFAAHCGQVPLSTVSHPVEKIVEGIAQLLLSRLDKEYDGAPRTLTVSGEFVARASTQEFSGA